MKVHPKKKLKQFALISARFLEEILRIIQCTFLSEETYTVVVTEEIVVVADVVVTATVVVTAIVVVTAQVVVL